MSIWKYLLAGGVGFVVAKLFEEDEAPKYADGGLIAPNGKPSNLTPEQYKLVRSQAFKKWFGDWENDPANASKVVDENGEPLILFHGSKSEKDFHIFNESNFIYFSNKKSYVEKHFAKNLMEYPFRLKEYFLNIRNLLNAEHFDFEARPYEQIQDLLLPTFDIDNDVEEVTKYKNEYIRFWEVLRFSKRLFSSMKQNKVFDGILFYENWNDYTTWEKIEDWSLSFVVLNSNQIKLADGSNTTFDSNNPDIRYAGGGEIEYVIEQVKLEVDLSYYKQNIQYHSLYPKLKNLNFFDDDEKVTSILVKGFINDVKAKSELVNGKIRLYRALAIKNIEKLNVEKLGIYWSVNEDKTGVFDDEGYEHKEKPNYESVFIIRAEFNTKDIDWQNSFDLYVMNDWMEGEIRVVDGSEAYNLKIKKRGDKKWLNI